MEKEIKKKTLAIEKSVLDKFERLLDFDNLTLEVLEDEGIDNCDGTLWSETVDFGEGIEADIKVCLAAGRDDGKPFIWSEGVLFDHGIQVWGTDCSYELRGEWEFFTPCEGEDKDDVIKYVVEVVEK